MRPGIMTHMRPEGRWCAASESVQLQCLYLTSRLDALTVLGLCQTVDRKCETALSVYMETKVAESACHLPEDSLNPVTPANPSDWACGLVPVGDILPRRRIDQLPSPPPAPEPEPPAPLPLLPKTPATPGRPPMSVKLAPPRSATAASSSKAALVSNQKPPVTYGFHFGEEISSLTCAQRHW